MFLTIKLYLHLNYMLMINWIVWNGTIFDIETVLVIFWPSPRPKMLFQGDTPEGSDTFKRPVIERDRVGGLRLMIWDKVKVLLCHYSHAPEESNLWTAWQLFPLDDDKTFDFKDPVGVRVGVELLFNSVEFGSQSSCQKNSKQ